jgi:hypothetical protein
MMHASSYSFSQDCHPKVAITFYVGGITRTLSIYIASRQLHTTYAFVVSVPAENFIAAQDPHKIYNTMKAVN